MAIHPPSSLVWEQSHPPSPRATSLVTLITTSLSHIQAYTLSSFSHEHRVTPHVSRCIHTHHRKTPTCEHPGTLAPKETYPGVTPGFLLYSRHCVPSPGCWRHAPASSQGLPMSLPHTVTLPALSSAPISRHRLLPQISSWETPLASPINPFPRIHLSLLLDVPHSPAHLCPQASR